MIYGQLNPDSGSPELLATPDNTTEDGKVIASSGYDGVAVFHNGDATFVCFGAYWEGALSSDMIGKAYRLQLVLT